MGAFFLSRHEGHDIERLVMDMRNGAHAIFYLPRFHTKIFGLCYHVRQSHG